MNGFADDREGFAAFLLRMRAAGMDDRRLIAAIEATPRRNFVAAQWLDAIWSSQMIPIPCGEAIEGLDLQARSLAALSIEPGNRVLEIGTGSGFTTALLGRLADKVLSVERFRTLCEQARQRLDALGLNNIVIRHADGAGGAPVDAPFDRIICWAAFESLPRVFVDQLSTNGIMVAPVGPPDGVQWMARLQKVGSRFERHDIAKVRLQPVHPGVAAAI